MAEQRTLDAERERQVEIAERIEAIIDSTMFFRHSAEGKAVLRLLKGLSKSNHRAPPALDAEGLPELPEPIDELSQLDGFNTIGLQAVYTAEQVRQVARDAKADADREIGLLKMVCDRLKARLTAADALIMDMATKADRAQLARQSAPEGAPVVKIERGRVWIVKGNQSFMLAYEADDDEPENVEWYASKLRSAIGCFTPGVKVEGAPVGMEAVAWLEAEASARGRTARQVLNSFVYSTRMHTKAAPVTSNPVWALYAPTSASAQPADQNKMEKNDE